MQDLRVSLVQGDTRWHDPEGNRAMYSELVRPLAGRSDLIVLPETFTSGFSNEAIADAEGMDGPTIPWLKALAAETGAAITGTGRASTTACCGRRRTAGCATTTSATCFAWHASTSATRRADGA
jgi:omega-amidase